MISKMPVLTMIVYNNYRERKKSDERKNAYRRALSPQCPGNTVVLGAGSIVTKDLSSNVVAVGNPCRILRAINDYDRKYYFKGRVIPEDILNK